MTRRPPPPPPPPLFWDGHTLHGTPSGRLAEVWVPARFLSVRRESLPAATLPARKAALRLRADRLFAPLGPVAVDALLHPPQAGTCEALLLALPKPVLDAIEKAAQVKNIQLRAVRVAELMQPVPSGGLVTVGGGAFAETSLVQVENGQCVGIFALGSARDEAFPAHLTRERLRLGIDANASGAPIPALQPDFLHPGLLATEPFLARKGARLALWAAGILLTAVLGLSLSALAAVHERNATRGQLAQMAPAAKILAGYHADNKNLAPWFEARPDLAPCLHALAGALPPLGSADRVRLSRVRQNLGEATVVEGIAGDRAQMMAFLARLRQDPQVTSAEIRTFRSPSNESAEVVFELGLRTDAAMPRAPAATPEAVPAAKGDSHEPA